MHVAVCLGRPKSRGQNEDGSYERGEEGFVSVHHEFPEKLDPGNLTPFFLPCPDLGRQTEGGREGGSAINRYGSRYFTKERKPERLLSGHAFTLGLPQG